MKLPPKIVITGTHGTGKSTLVAAVAAHYRAQGLKVEIAQEFGRRYVEYTGDARRLQPGASNPARQIISLFHDVQEEYRAMAAGPDIVICDRGVVDSLTYSLAVGETYDQVDMAFTRDLINSHVKTYDLVIRLPVEFPMPYDGVRPADIAFQQFIDTEMDKEWRDAGARPVTVTGTVAQRVAQAAGMIAPLLPQATRRKPGPAPG